MNTAPLPDEIKTLLQQHGRSRSLQEGETLIALGQPILTIPFVVTGSIKIMTENANGHELLLYHLRPGESCVATLLNAAQTLGSASSISTIKAVAEENTEVMLIPEPLARELIFRNPDWNQFVLSLYQKRFEELLRAVGDVAFRKVDERLIDLLRRKADFQQSTILYVTHQQLADELGTVREVVSRLLKRLEQDGRLELQRGKIKLSVPL